MSLLNYTDSEIAEYQLCRASPIYFLRKYFNIIHVKKGPMLFDMYKCQEDLVWAFHLNQHNLSLSSRQSGATTCYIGYALWSALFRKDYSVVIAANKYSEAKHLMQHILFAYDLLPDWMKLKLTTRNRTNIEFENGSAIHAFVAGIDAGRGRSINLFIWDNAMWTRETVAADMWYYGIAPKLVSTNAKTIVTSSGTKLLKGNESNMFAELWYGAQKNTNGFKCTVTSWNSVPNRDESFKARVIEQLGEEQWRREYECEFVSEE